MKRKQESTTELKGFGPVSRSLLKQMEIYDLSDLSRIGVIETYRMAKARFFGVSLNFLWALQACLMGISWREVPRELKDELKRELAIVESELTHSRLKRASRNWAKEKGDSSSSSQISINDHALRHPAKKGVKAAINLRRLAK